MNDTLYTAAADVESAIFKLPVEKWQATIKQMERGFLVNRLFIQVLEVSSTGKESLKTAARSGVLAVNISQQGVWQKLSRRFPPKPVYMNVNLDNPGSHPLRIILYPVKFGDGKEYLIQVGTSLIKILKILKNFLMILMVSAPVLLLVSVLGGFLILTKALQPVKSVVHTAQKITAEDLSLRIDSKNRKDEIGLLISTFNRMISRLERSVLEIKQFSSDASMTCAPPSPLSAAKSISPSEKNALQKNILKHYPAYRKKRQNWNGSSITCYSFPAWTPAITGSLFHW